MQFFLCLKFTRVCFLSIVQFSRYRLSFQTTLILYHISFRLSRGFLKFFQKLFGALCNFLSLTQECRRSSLNRTLYIISHRLELVKYFFGKIFFPSLKHPLSFDSFIIISPIFVFVNCFLKVLCFG